MEKRTISTTGIEVPAICLGTMTWGQQNTEAEAHEQLDYAVDERGLYFLDTAEVYPIPPEKEKQGRTETYIGNWLKQRGRREDLVIASKVCVAPPLMQTRDAEVAAHYSKESIHTAIDGTLERLQTDYIDIYQIHWPERPTNFFGSEDLRITYRMTRPRFERRSKHWLSSLKLGRSDILGFQTKLRGVSMSTCV